MVFEWIDHSNANDSVISYMRKGETPGDYLIVVCNFTPVVRHDYRIGVNEFCRYQEIFNSDDVNYWGSGVKNEGFMQAENVPCNDKPNSVRLTLPPAVNHCYQTGEIKPTTKEPIMQKIKPADGKAWPLGASWDGKGVNFALFSANAEKVEVCLFDDAGVDEIARYALPKMTTASGTFTCRLKPGQVYGYRVYGPYLPEEGHRFNPNKLLIDPYAKKLTGRLIWHKALFGYDWDSPLKDLSYSTLDSAPLCAEIGCNL